VSTRDATFSFGGGFGDDVAPATLDDVRDFLRGSEVASLLPPGNIDPQTQMQGSGIPITKIRRGLLGPLLGGPSNYTITSTTPVEVDGALLAGTLVCTGRPVLVLLAAGVLPTNTVWLSVAMDGADVSTRGGMTYSQLATTPVPLSSWEIVAARPGPRRFAMTARVNAGSAVVYSDLSGNRVEMLVVEL
jgi:hypothetical protein